MTPSDRGRLGRRLAIAAGAAGAAVLAAVLVGADAAGTKKAVDDTSGTQRFLAGDGTGAYLARGDRPVAPELTGTGLDGKALSTAAWRGSPYVVNVWGSWCAPCKKEQPDLQRASVDAAELGVRFVGINVRDPSPVAAQAHVRRFAVTYPSFYDPSSTLVARFRDIPPTAIPTTLVVDRDGRVAARVFGGVDYAALMDVVRRVAAEPAR